MPQPTNTEMQDEIIAAIHASESRLNQRINGMETRLGNIETALTKVLETSTRILNSQHSRDLNLAERVEHLEQGVSA